MIGYKLINLSLTTPEEYSVNYNEAVNELITICTNTYSLNESFSDSIKNMLDKINDRFKAVFSRIKQFFTKFNGNTSEWVSSTEIVLNKVSKLPGFDQQSFNMYKWNSAFITTDIVTAMNKIKTEVLDDVSTRLSKLDKELSDRDKETIDEEVSVEGKKTFVEYVFDIAKREMTLRDKVGTSSELATAMALKAKGDDKRDITLADLSTSKMVKTIKSCDSVIKDILTASSKAEETLKKLIDDIEKKEVNGDDGYDTKIIKIVTHMIQNAVVAISVIGSTGANMMRTMVTDYKNVIHDACKYNPKKTKDGSDSESE